jgi:8-oxo-dGTP diphosphatase
MTAYVAGFLIDRHARTVAVVRKRKPQWQAGRLNGIGGKVEPGETASEAMRREFNEEAGVDIGSWSHYATVEGDWGSVEFFRAWGDVWLVRTMEEEPIEVHRLDDFPYGEALPNLSWLIPLALYTYDAYAPVVAREETPDARP